MWLAAVINIVLGLLFIGIGIASPDLRVFLFIGPFLLLIGLGVAVWAIRSGQAAARDQVLRQTGTRGSAQIVEADQTGVYINQQPQVRMKLRVSVLGQPAYEIQKTEIVPLVQIGRLSSGMPLAVFIDPADRDHVLIAWNEIPDAAAAPAPSIPGAVFDAGHAAAGVNSAAAQLAAMRIQQTGQDGTGTLMTFEDLGAQPDGNHKVKYDMLVAVPGRQPYQLHKETEIPAVALRLMEVGKTFALKLDPANPEHPLLTIA